MTAIKALWALGILLSAQAFAEDHAHGRIICEDEGPHGIVCYKPDLKHKPTDTNVQRARYHMERIHLMMLAIEGKKPLQPLPTFSKKLPERKAAIYDGAEIDIDIDLGDDISAPLR